MKQLARELAKAPTNGCGTETIVYILSYVATRGMLLQLVDACGPKHKMAAGN